MGFTDSLDEMGRDLEERQRGIQQDLDELAAREFIGRVGDGSVRAIPTSPATYQVLIQIGQRQRDA